MIAAVVKNKFKKIKYLNTAKTTGWFFAKAATILTRCKGGMLLTKNDGTFIDISFWDEERTIKCLIENPLIKRIMNAFKSTLSKPYEIKYYKVDIKLDKTCSLIQFKNELSKTKHMEKSNLTPLDKATILEKRYKIIELIKLKKRKAVYKILDTNLDTILALKEIQLPFESDSQITEWVNMKGHFFAGLAHKSIPEISDYFVKNDRFYLVMNFIEGKTLTEIFKSDFNKDLKESEIVRWTEDILKVVDYLHENSSSLSYHDIKPADIMIRNDGKAILTNLGITKSLYNNYGNLPEEKDEIYNCTSGEFISTLKENLSKSFSNAKDFLEALPFIKKINIAKNNFFKIMDENIYGDFLKKDYILKNRYTIISHIETGGMGAIYKGLDKKFKNLCAIKELLPAQSLKVKKETHEWFKREAKLLAELSHPSLPKVFDYFIENNRYYLVMEFIEGDNLEEILEKQGNPGLKEEKVIEWSKDILKVLDYLHNQNPPIVFRDIKPGNIIINQSGKANLIDFGIARKLQKNSEQKKTSIGTEGYSPLEQYQGKVEVRSDIYALGATMHHLLTGRSPIPFKFPSVRKIVPSLSPEIESIIKKSLKENVNSRFSSSKEMLKALIFKDKRAINKTINNDVSEKESYENAIAYYNEALELDSKYAWTWVTKGGVLKKLKKYEEAIECFDKALEINPNYCWAWATRGKTLKKLEKYEEALECFNRALESEQEYDIAWDYKGDTLSALEKYEEAIECFNKALTIDNNYYVAWNNKGEVLLKQGKYDEAYQCFSKAIEINPEFDKALKNKEICLNMRENVS